jgi:polyphosphate kinase
MHGVMTVERRKSMAKKKPNDKSSHKQTIKMTTKLDKAPQTEIMPEKEKGKKIKNKIYEAKLARLQIELVKLQEWIKHKGLKVVVLFEGRDAAGKGGCIKRITQTLSPRVCPVVGLASTYRARENTVVFSALRAAFASCRRNGVVRPQLV